MCTFTKLNFTLEFALQLDTGSADLVIFPDKPIKTTSVMEDAFVNSSYVKGWYAGPAATAKLEFGGYTVESQGMCYWNDSEIYVLRIII